MTVAVASTTLVLSFTGAIRGIYRGRVSAEMMAGGVFYFSCAREHLADEPGSEYQDYLWREYEADPAGVWRAYRQMVQLARAAEASGRIMWRDLHGENSIEQLNQLLASNGLPVIDPNWKYSQTSTPLAERYYTSAICDEIRALRLPYSIIT